MSASVRAPGARLLGILAVTLTAILWGTTGTAATFAPEVGPLAIGAAALGVGGLLQAVAAAGPLCRERRSLRAHAGLIGLGAVAVAVYPLAFYSSMHLAGVAIGSVVSLASAPLVSGVIERVAERRTFSLVWMLAAGLGIAGSVLLCLSGLAEGAEHGGAGHGGASGALAGIALGLLAGTAYALYSWAASRLMGAGVSRAAAMGAVFGAGGSLLVPVLLVTGAPLLASGQSFAVAAYMALVPMFLGYLLFGLGLARVGASTATTITLSEPAVATLLAVVVVGERLGVLGWSGAAVIAASLLVLVLAPVRSPTAALAPAVVRPPRVSGDLQRSER